MGPKNAVMGDENFGTDLPRTQVSEDQLNEEKNLARYSQSEEFKKFKDHMLQRIAFYQSYLPGTTVGPNGEAQVVSKPVAAASKQERADMWAVANMVIGEFEAVLGIYDSANEVVRADAQKGTVRRPNS